TPLSTTSSSFPYHYTPTTQIYTLSLHDALPISFKEVPQGWKQAHPSDQVLRGKWWEIFQDPELNALEEQINVSNQTLRAAQAQRSEEHTSELQSPDHLVCRLLLEKKKKKARQNN